MGSRIAADKAEDRPGGLSVLLGHMVVRPGDDKRLFDEGDPRVVRDLDGGLPAEKLPRPDDFGHVDGEALRDDLADGQFAQLAEVGVRRGV